MHRSHWQGSSATCCTMMNKTRSGQDTLHYKTMLRSSGSYTRHAFDAVENDKQSSIIDTCNTLKPLLRPDMAEGWSQWQQAGGKHEERMEQLSTSAQMLNDSLSRAEGLAQRSADVASALASLADAQRSLAYCLSSLPPDEGLFVFQLLNPIRLSCDFW